MKFVNVETPSFAGSAGVGVAPAVDERLSIRDRNDVEVGYINKAVDGSVDMVLNGETLTTGKLNAAVEDYDEAASPATGLHHLHEMEGHALLDDALGKKQDAKKEPMPVAEKSAVA